MTIHELFNDGILELPLDRNDGESFRDFLFKRLDDFEIKIKQLDLSRTYLYPDKETQKIYDLLSGIRDCLGNYFCGRPPEAYHVLKEAFAKALMHQCMIVKTRSQDSKLYRLRVKEANYTLSKSEMFHIPFNLRNLVATQRYSIPGFPCLYVSNCLYLAWEEMGRKELGQLQAVMIKTKEEFKFLDLTTDIYSRNYDTDCLTEDVLLGRLIAWPVIAACSVKVKRRDDPFKPEYIVPQLLLQWVRNERPEDALAFSSTHVNLNSSSTKGALYNFVVPVKTDFDSGYCPELLKIFDSTEVVSWQLYQATYGSSGTLLKHSGIINPEVEKIELLRGHPLPYEFSPLSSLEHVLNNMPAGPILP